jgi:hypothetical protein
MPPPLKPTPCVLEYEYLSVLHTTDQTAQGSKLPRSRRLINYCITVHCWMITYKLAWWWCSCIDMYINTCMHTDVRVQRKWYVTWICKHIQHNAYIILFLTWVKVLWLKQMNLTWPSSSASSSSSFLAIVICVWMGYMNWMMCNISLQAMSIHETGDLFGHS